MGAKTCRHGGKIRIVQTGATDAIRIFAFLMHADGAVSAVVGKDDDDWNIILNCGGELLTRHHKIAVTGVADYRNLWPGKFAGNGCRYPIPHRA